MKRKFRLRADLSLLLGLWEVFGLVLSGTALTPSPYHSEKDVWEMSVITLLFFHLPCAFGLWCLLRTQISVDEEGMRFRSPFKTQSVAWEQIDDFGWDASKSKVWMAVVWTGGQKKQLLRLYKGFDELRELVAERAVNAPTREWALVGARDCDQQPQTFIYRDTPNWKIGALFFGVLTLMTLQMTGGALDKGWATYATNLTQIWSALEVWGRIAFAGTMLFMVLAMPVVVTSLFCLGLRTKRRFLEQFIVVSPEGLEQWNGPSRRVCAWNDVERFELEQVPGTFQLPLCVVWAKGQRFDWHSGIENGLALKSIVRQRATNAQTNEWKYRSGADADILGGELSLWPSGVVGIGAKRYHYRTRTTRSLLALGWIITPLVVIVPLITRVFPPSTSGDVLNLLGGLLLFSPYLVLTLGGTRAYFTCWLERDEDGLHHASIFGTRHLSWREIRHVQLNEHFLEIRGDKTKIRVGPLADQEHLLGDIECHSGVKVEKVGKMRSGI